LIPACRAFWTGCPMWVGQDGLGGPLTGFSSPNWSMKLFPHEQHRGVVAGRPGRGGLERDQTEPLAGPVATGASPAAGALSVKIPACGGPFPPISRRYGLRRQRSPRCGRNPFPRPERSIAASVGAPGRPVRVLRKSRPGPSGAGPEHGRGRDRSHPRPSDRSRSIQARHVRFPGPGRTTAGSRTTPCRG